ncbi:hypothetical protein SAMN02745164_01523 [Marinitoga hydrogenitolerans DSM 16785]|uniref:Uncharacterized protein n=1 Tax=Marinitoga hydrogenitolerans (strain DSM 16785 / JCM 12826 / AT1271) TaxID=1122195 RepID=A0A1M4XV45_MARH1|nr:hypothetical protein [Marinitoga hydrogenitolerans]SHE97300.1 hypothetical protein SAMN02745164_01523 [Marinitoga hydrogenitolerans DSM 16785]
MKKRTLFLIALLIIFLLTSCFNFRNSENTTKENLNSILVEKNGDEFIVKSNIEADSFELTIENIDAKNIYIPSEFLKIIKKEKYLKIAISSPKTIRSGDIIMKINTSNFKINNVETYNRFSITKNFDYYDKGVSFGLLGDFDFDGSVGISDFSSFTVFYGSERSNFDGNMKDFDLIDIGPAKNFSHKGIWNDIFDLAVPDGKISLSDFSIFAFNYSKNIISSQPTIVVNANTDISEIQDNIEKNIVKGLKQIPTLISTITDFITNNPDLINSISSSFLTESSTPIIKYLINMTEATETALLTIIEDINEFSNLLGSVQYGYLYNDIKFEINNFDWDGDGTIEETSPLMLKIKNDDGSITNMEFYKLFKIYPAPQIVGIDQNGGDAVFDYELFFDENIDENYTPSFDNNDYLLIDEGTVSGISLVTNIIGIIGKALFIYDLNNPSLNIKNAINNDENLKKYISNLLIDLLKNPPPADSEKILGEELQNSIFGNMLIFRDYNKSIELINNIKNDLLSLNKLINVFFEDKIMDYIENSHDITSGEKPPVPDYIFNNSMNFLKQMEDLANLINNPSESVEIPIGYNQSFNLYPGIYFDNPTDFSDLNIFLPDISLILTYDSTELLFELPDSTFKGLIEGLDSTFTINIEDLGKEQYFIYQDDISIIGTSVTLRWHLSPDLNATITYEVLIDTSEVNIWNYIDEYINSQDLLKFIKTSNTQITINLNEGDYFWAVIGYADFGNGKIEKIYPENPYWFSVFSEENYYFIDLIKPEYDRHFTESPTIINFEWQAYFHQNNENINIDADYYILHIEQLTEPWNYYDYQLTTTSISLELESGIYGWWVEGYYTNPDTFENIDLDSQYNKFKVGTVEEVTYFYPIEPPEFIQAPIDTTSMEIYFKWGVNNLPTEKSSNDIFKLYYRDEDSENWQVFEDIDTIRNDEFGNYEAEAFVDGFLPNTSYEWKIRAYINDSDYIEGPIWYFYIEESILLLDLHSIHPLDGEATTTLTNEIEFIWGYDPEYIGNFELHIKPIDTWDNTYDTIVTPTDYATDTDPVTGEITFNFTKILPDGIYKWWVSIPTENYDNYKETEHRWLFVNTDAYKVLLDYPEPMSIFDYYTISFGWHTNYFITEHLNDLIFEIMDEDGNIIYSEPTNSDNWTYVTFENEGLYSWYLKDFNENIVSAKFAFEIQDWWSPTEENIINLYNPLNGEIFISTEPYTNLTFSWENIDNIYDYSFQLTSAKKFIETSVGYIENFDYPQNNYYNLELKDGIYLWLVETNDLEYSKYYISPIRSFNILKNNDLKLDIDGPSNMERSTPLDKISFIATSLSNSQIKYYVLMMNDWGEVSTKPNIFENDLIGNSGDIMEIELWELFNGQEYDGIYYYAVIADDGNNIIISPVKSFMYDNTLYNNFVRFSKDQINLTDTATFSIITQGNDINDVRGLEIYLKVDPESISIDSSSLKIGSNNGFIKSSIKSNNWNNEEYMEIIISIYSDSSFDLSNTEIAEFEISKKGLFANTFIDIIDGFVLFKDNTTPIRLEIENNIEITDSE